METRLTHVRINVRDLQAAINWYCEVLGYEVRNMWPPEDANYADFLPSEGASFSIMEADPVPTGGRCNFSVDDVDALWEELKDRVEVVEPLHETAYGSRKFTIRDPDGNELGLVAG